MIALPYTLCFCLQGEQVLMLYRSRPPNAGRWNGLGGKIEADETPLLSICREVLEEAEMDLHQADEVCFGGLVTWTFLQDPERSNRGMYVYLARLASDVPIEPTRVTSEGLLSWKALSWVCDPGNPLVVSNIPHFLPRMLTAPQPLLYHCSYQDEVLQAVVTSTLPPEIRDR